jgi:aspartate/methionine/tyrosine aminotransferase
MPQNKLMTKHKSNSQLLDITQHEIAALKMRYNLADAHTHQRQSDSQKEFIISHLPDLWYESEKKTQYELEQKFIQAFFSLHRQPTALKTGRNTLYYSASVATMVVANYLRQKGMSTALVEPCFDNLHDLLKNHQVDIHRLEENWLHEPHKIYQNLSASIQADSIFIVDPNNPTGFSMLIHQQQAFREVIRFCKDHKKLLIFDFCFASFALMDQKVGRFDIYALLEDSGVQYIAIEDTGKTWPLQDAKCAIMTVSSDLYQDIYSLHTAVLLNVSPFVLNLVTQYLYESKRDNFYSITSLLETNREMIKRELFGHLLEYCEPKVNVSVSWWKIKDNKITATELQKLLQKEEIYVLPGTYFFWSDHSQGEDYIRIALAREPEMFAAAIKLIKEVIA